MPPSSSRREPRLKKPLLDLDSLNTVKTESSECGLDLGEKSELLPELSPDCRMVAVALFRCVLSKIHGHAMSCVLEHCRDTETE